MPELTHREPETALSNAGTGATSSLLPPGSMACLALGQPDAESIGWLAGEVDNSLLLACMGQGPVDTAATPTVAPLATPSPWSEDVWRYGNLRPGAVHGKDKQDGTPSPMDLLNFVRYQGENAKYDGILNDDRARVASAAAQDRAAGIPSAVVDEDDRMRALWAVHGQLANMDYGDGGQGPAGYYIHEGRMITERASSPARAAATGAIGEENLSNALLTGKPGVKPLETAVARLGGASEAPWMATDMRERLARISPEGLDPRHQGEAQMMAFFQHAGIGIDCEGYSRDIVLGGLPGSQVNTDYNATGWGRTAGGKGQGGVASPVKKDGSLGVRPGDILNIDPSTEEERQKARDAGLTPPLKHSHIGVVLQVVDNDDEVVMRLGHSTPNQDQYNGNTFLGERPEGPRDDVYVYNKAAQTWHTVRGAFSDDRVASDKDNHLPLFSEFRTWDERGGAAR